jgi:hypothetical protein
MNRSGAATALHHQQQRDGGGQWSPRPRRIAAMERGKSRNTSTSWAALLTSTRKVTGAADRLYGVLRRASSSAVGSAHAAGDHAMRDQSGERGRSIAGIHQPISPPMSDET